MDSARALCVPCRPTRCSGHLVRLHCRPRCESPGARIGFGAGLRVLRVRPDVPECRCPRSGRRVLHAVECTGDVLPRRPRNGRAGVLRRGTVCMGGSWFGQEQDRGVCCVSRHASSGSNLRCHDRSEIWSFAASSLRESIPRRSGCPTPRRRGERRSVVISVGTCQYLDGAGHVLEFVVSPLVRDCPGCALGDRSYLESGAPGCPLSE